MKIGIFGGSFDPIHRSHVRVIEESLRQLDLDKLLVMPTANNPWKDSSGATKKQRLDMLHIALDRYAKVEICTYEINQDDSKKNYTIDTIKHLKKVYPEDQLYFIMGMDQASLFHKWVDAKKLSKLAQLVVFDRVGYQTNENIQKYNFIRLDLTATDDASNEIRNGKLHALQPEVLKYIVNNGIYLETMIKNKMSKKRYRHTVSMAHLAKEFAKNNGLDATKAYVAGMLHDIAKEMDYDDALKIMNEHYPQYVDKAVPIWHQWLSEYVAKTEYLVDDREILQAIRHHTTGSLGMSKLDMCIYTADKYDPSRDYDSSKEIALCNQDIEAGFASCLQDFYDFSTKKGREIDQCFFEIYNKFVKGEINE
ncbi:nicotinate-nucleotide adenylyltransferase [uncultured Thomasclavelia sp.]|uniref:nicotinate-nucleotide adenylyltransferase n=1 Tax=uncultured Thomasclavelia sp. TaxID=3025759 RepID=UPI0025EBE5DB|nr:nicotinate-nucleotide adenylyltransferase [uncultured Thomasclavelia sp.]